VIADYLTQRGIAVLRFDKRGIGRSTGSYEDAFEDATIIDFAGDVLAGMDYLKTRKEIDPESLGLICHNEGGIIAKHVATKSPDIAFMVIMASDRVNADIHDGYKPEARIKALFCIKKETIAPMVLQTIKDWIWERS